MSYIINKTDGSVLTEVVDGTIDQITTDVTLVGKNASTYGELFNENFIKILENFANTSQPNKPLEGQLWYDTAEGRLKVYDGNGFKVSGGTIVSDSIPSSIAAGDIWIDSFRRQMYFNDGNSNLLAGPAYTAQQGISGFQVVDVIDSNNINHTIIFLYVGQVLLGIFSNSTFTLLETIPGFTGLSINVGFTSAYSAVRFKVPASQADSLIAQDGSAKTAESFLAVDPIDGYTIGNGTIRILNNQALVLGGSQNNEVTIADNALQINSNIINQNFSIRNFNANGILPSFFINAANEWTGIYTDTPTATLDVNGSVRIRENLVVEGNITSINNVEINVEDIIINLGKTTNPDNTTANGGGILLEAGLDGDKTILWNTTLDEWQSNQNFGVAATKVFKIGTFEVLSQTELGLTVTNAPGLSSIGQLVQLKVDNIDINSNVISFSNVGIANGDIVITPKGTGVLNVSSSKITNLLYEVDSANAPTTTLNNTDAAPIAYVNWKAGSVPLGFSTNYLPYTLGQEATFASTVLNKIFQIGEHEENTLLRVYCPDVARFLEYKRVYPNWAYQSDIT
jgi:hypothetical protein